MPLWMLAPQRGFTEGSTKCKFHQAAAVATGRKTMYAHMIIYSMYNALNNICASTEIWNAYSENWWKHPDPDSRKGFERCANDLSSNLLVSGFRGCDWKSMAAFICFQSQIWSVGQGLYATEPRARDFLPLAIHASVAHEWGLIDTVHNSRTVLSLSTKLHVFPTGS